MLLYIMHIYYVKIRFVSLLTSGGILAVSPATLAHQTIRYEYAAIQTMEPMNVTGKNLLPRGVRVSGSVNHNGKIIGATNKYVMRSFVPDGHAMLSASGSSSPSGPYD
jgi:chorismate mutase